jgi:hypothetical protein
VKAFEIVTVGKLACRSHAAACDMDAKMYRERTIPVPIDEGAGGLYGSARFVDDLRVRTPTLTSRISCSP